MCSFYIVNPPGFIYCNNSMSQWCHSDLQLKPQNCICSHTYGWAQEREKKLSIFCGHIEVVLVLHIKWNSKQKKHFETKSQQSFQQIVSQYDQFYWIHFWWHCVYHRASVWITIFCGEGRKVLMVGWESEIWESITRAGRSEGYSFS